MGRDDITLVLLIGIFALMGVTLLIIIAPVNHFGEIRLGYFTSVIKDVGSDGCAGVDRYYTGLGFWNDSQSFMDAYWESRVGREYDFLEASYKILPPEKLGSFDYDCEDVARGLWCISEQYNIECDFYYQENHDKHGLLNHIGVECLFGSRWIPIS